MKKFKNNTQVWKKSKLYFEYYFLEPYGPIVYLNYERFIVLHQVHPSSHTDGIYGNNHQILWVLGK